MDAGMPSLTDALSGYQAAGAAHSADVSKQLDAAKTERDTKVAKADEEEASLDPDALKPPKLAPPPTPKATEPMAIWGSAAMAIASLGGLLTRRPLTNSLTAAAAVMDAYRKGDAAAAQTAYDTWKTESDNAVKMAQFTLDSYKASLSRIKEDRAGASADFLATARALGDENAAYVAQHYGMDAVIRYTGDLQKHLDTITKVTPTLDLKNEDLKLKSATLEAVRALQVARTGGDPAKIRAAEAAVSSAQEQQRAFDGKGDEGTGLSPTALNEMAEQYLTGDKSVLSGLGYGKQASAARIQLRNIIADKMKKDGTTPEEVASRLATFDTTSKAFAVKAQGNAVRSFGVLLSHFDTLKKVYDALKNGDQRTFSSLKNQFETEFGYPAPSNVDAARHIIGDEIVKAVTGAGGALGDRETAQNTINLASSPEQVDGLLSTYRELATGQLRGLRQQFEAGGGQDFDKLLSPAAKQTLAQPTDAEVASAPHVTSKEEFDALARKGHGILYIEPDGKLYRTP